MRAFTDEYLAHHGVLGQKWGVRRYQNKDGSLTSAGKKRLKAPPNTKALPNYNGPAYFISVKSGLKKLEPRVPDNYFTKNGYEDNKTPRVSFAPSIGKCLAGLSQNVDGQTFYVYSPDDTSKYSFYKPNDKAVPDSKITDELWITESVDLSPVSVIKVTGNRNESGKKFSFGSNTAELYDDWLYEEKPTLKHSLANNKETFTMQLFSNDYLEHHGIPGQKWGVRRYQNKDGSLTPAGRKRLASGGRSSVGETLSGAVSKIKAKSAARKAVKAEAAAKAKAAKEPHEDYASVRKKTNVRDMSNQELKSAYDRLKMENLYKAEYAKQHKETPKEYVKRVAVEAVKKHGQTVAEYMVGKAINKAFGAEVIKGLATKENVDAGKKTYEEIKKAVNPDGTDYKAKFKEAYNKAKGAYDTVDNFERNAAINAAAAYVNSGKKAYDHVKEDYYERYDDKVYEGEVVNDRSRNNSGSSSTAIVPVYTIPDRPQLEDLRYDTRKSKRNKRR